MNHPEVLLSPIMPVDLMNCHIRFGFSVEDSEKGTLLYKMLIQRIWWTEVNEVTMVDGWVNICGCIGHVCLKTANGTLTLDYLQGGQRWTNRTKRRNGNCSKQMQ